jgi:hypothetical protein
MHLKREQDAILVAVQELDGTCHVNPAEYAFTGNEHVVVIAESRPEL